MEGFPIKRAQFQAGERSALILGGRRRVDQKMLLKLTVPHDSRHDFLLMILKKASPAARNSGLFYLVNTSQLIQRMSEYGMRESLFTGSITGKFVCI